MTETLSIMTTISRKRKTPMYEASKEITNPSVGSVDREPTEEVLLSSPKESVNFSITEKSVTSFGISTPFPSCCGATIFHNFGTSATTFRNDMKVLLSRTLRKGLITLIINNKQKGYKFDKVLEEFGFKCIFVTSNPNMSDMTTLYLYALDTGGREAK